MKRTILIVIVALLAAAGAWANWPGSELPADALADRVVVKKSSRTLELYSGDELLRSYRVSLGHNPVGDKQEEGDGRTPEGEYLLDEHVFPSSYYKAIHVSYPSAEDTAAAQARGVKPGGNIEIHGIRNRLGLFGRLHTVMDWTDGCIAVTNREMDEIARVVGDRTPISIQP